MLWYGFVRSGAVKLGIISTLDTHVRDATNDKKRL